MRAEDDPGVDFTCKEEYLEPQEFEQVMLNARLHLSWLALPVFDTDVFRLLDGHYCNVLFIGKGTTGTCHG